MEQQIVDKSDKLLMNLQIVDEESELVKEFYRHEEKYLNEKDDMVV